MGVQLPAWADTSIAFFFTTSKTGSEAYLASYPLGNRCSFHGGTEASA